MGVRSLLLGQWGAIFFREPDAPARGGRGVLPRGCSESPARPVGGHLLQRTGRTGPGGTGSPAQGVFGVSCQANGGPSSSENRAHRPGGDGESSPGGGRSFLQGLRGWTTGRTGLGGRGILPRGWSEFPAGPAGMDNRAHRPGGTGNPAQGVVGVSCRACGDGQPGPPALGDGESCPGGGRSVLQGPWGRRTGQTGLGGWGVQPRGWSEFPAGPAGMDNRAHRPGGMGSPAQGVFGVSCKASGGPCSSENRAHRPGGDGESSPGGGRSFLQGLRGWTTGPTGIGGWGDLPRGWSERPPGPVGT